MSERSPPGLPPSRSRPAEAISARTGRALNSVTAAFRLFGLPWISIDVAAAGLLEGRPVTSVFNRSDEYIGSDPGFDRGGFRLEIDGHLGLRVGGFDGLLDRGGAMSAGHVFYSDVMHRKSPLI